MSSADSHPTNWTARDAWATAAREGPGCRTAKSLTRPETAETQNPQRGGAACRATEEGQLRSARRESCGRRGPDGPEAWSTFASRQRRRRQ